jgi:ketosteroid isomerase-like protein
MMTRTPYRIVFAAIVLALTVACSNASNTPPTAEINAVKAQASLNEAMDADKAFSAMAQAQGVGAAFAQYMDKVDGRMFQPGEIVQGEAAIREAFANWPANTQLVWAPDGGHGSASGDLAVTTGRFQNKVDGVTRSEGRYVTVWRRNAEGQWKGVMDIGVPDPPPPVVREPDPEGRPG